MFSEIILLFLTYFIILFSVLGYGFHFHNIFFKNYSSNSGIIGLIGIFFIIIYSYISHFFISHNLFHNSVFLLLGLFLFIINYKKKIDKTNFLILIFCFLILFLGIIIYKTHDDFPYYHFPYSYYLTQEPLIIGTGKYNHGFRTHSSIFYLNSLFYLPFIKYYTFYIPTVLLMGFANLIFISEIKKIIKNKNINFIFYYCLFFFIFFNIFFYRLQEHGTDRSAQILIALLILYIFNLIEFTKNQKKYIGYILILLGIIISLKAFYVLYFILGMPVIWILYKEKKLQLLFYTIKDKLFYMFLILFLLVISVYFLNTGCLLYPVSFTCFDGLVWSIGSYETSIMNDHYQLWSKAGKTPNFNTEEPNLYLENFNWLNNWFNLYFFNKVSDFLVGIIFLSVLVIFIFYSGKKKFSKKEKSYFNVKIIYFFFIILFLEWFVNHPSLRYGGYILFAFLIFLPISLYLERLNNDVLEIKKKLIILICITIIVFSGRNLNRIKDEMVMYEYSPIINPYYRITKSHFNVQNNFNSLIDNFKNCNLNLKDCDKELVKKVKQIFPNRYLFVND